VSLRNTDFDELNSIAHQGTIVLAYYFATTNKRQQITRRGSTIWGQATFSKSSEAAVQYSQQNSKASTKHAVPMFWNRLKAQLFVSLSAGVIRKGHLGKDGEGGAGRALDELTNIYVSKITNSISLRDFESHDILLFLLQPP
jgi:hypothetical protein